MSRIEDISKKSKDEILKSLDNAYRIKNFQHSNSIDPVEHIQSSGNAIEELKAKMSANKYIVEESSKDRLEEKINEIVSKYGYKKMIYGTGLGLDLGKINADEKICFDKEIENLRQDVFHSDFSVVNAKYGVSSHGVALLTSSKEQPRMLSLAPMLCIVLLKKENVVKSLSEALNLVKKESEILPSNILFVAGPSRTADIELITVFGVHGSQQVHIVLY
ncbi:lactate utilization protein C [uncultured Campylobacter sp.]|uniref:LutC/YkgG family protein n=1 Tax=uncultured Campylobacter sp. TaxID=218934 RepID=UPI00262C48B9|nr:lactate utilization protein C [uncultured Campylobacter sp.]